MWAVIEVPPAALEETPRSSHTTQRFVTDVVVAAAAVAENAVFCCHRPSLVSPCSVRRCECEHCLRGGNPWVWPQVERVASFGRLIGSVHSWR